MIKCDSVDPIVTYKTVECSKFENLFKAIVSPINNMNLHNLLRERRAPKGAEWTHTSLAGGSYYIPVDDIDTFMEFYKDALKSHENLHITERRRDLCPIIIDLDFRHKDTSTTSHKYNTTHVAEIVYALMQVIDEYIGNVDDTPIFVLTKPARVHNNIIKDGLHIVIPEVVTKVQFQKYLRHCTVNTIADILGPCNYSNPATDIYDKAIFTNNWMMYGSNKPTEPNKWTVEYIYTYKDCKVVPLEVEFSDDDLVEILSIRNKYDESPVKLEIPDFEEERQSVTPSNQTQGTQLQRVPESEDLIKALVKMLSNTRADNYNDWIKVGWCLHNINQAYLPIWIEFSKRSDKFKEGECEREWYRMNSGGLGLGSLYRWAKEDNPDEYNKLYERTLDNLIYKSRTGNNFEIANVIYHMYKGLYACIKPSGLNKIIDYQFINHRWVEEPGMTSLKIKMSTEVSTEYIRLAEYYRRRGQDAENQSGSEVNDDRKVANMLFAIAHKLKMTVFKSSMLRECQELFLRGEKEFYDQLDTKMNLIGFDDGIYDLDEGIFRAGRPEDLVTMTTRYTFPRESNYVARKYINNFMDSICSSPELKEYLLNVMAYALHGERKFQDNNLMFWSGCGANGKGVLKSLLMSVFGEYGYEPDPSILTVPKVDSSRACPEVAKLKSKRWCVTSEPETDQKFQISSIKRMTGGDMVQARDLYKSATEFKLQCVIVVLMNTKPSLSDYDGGIARRLNVIDFKYKFVQNPTLQHEKKIDTTIEIKFRDEKYKQEMMLMLLERYNRIIKGSNGIKKAPEIEEATRTYLEDNNVVKAFITENLEITNNREDIIGSSVMFQRFKDFNMGIKRTSGWFKDQMKLNGLVLERKTTRGELYTNNVYFCVKWKQAVEIVDELDT